jgi:hypothetical protein
MTCTTQSVDDPPADRLALRCGCSHLDRSAGQHCDGSRDGNVGNRQDRRARAGPAHAAGDKARLIGSLRDHASAAWCPGRWRSA